MPVCCIVKCGARKNTNQPQLSFHRFPKNEGLKKKWLEAIGDENINPRHKEWYLCSLHFEESCFNRTLDVMRLHANSVPKVFSAPDKKQHQESSDLCETSNIQKSGGSCTLGKSIQFTSHTRIAVPCTSQVAPIMITPQLSSSVRPRGSALPYGPIKVTSGPSTKCQIKNPLDPDFNPVITEIKSEADPIKQEEDPQSDDTLSLAEDTGQLSDADQPSEDLIPLSNTQVPLSNATDPLSDVKVEELEVGVVEVEVTRPGEVTTPVELTTPEELTRAVEVTTPVELITPEEVTTPVELTRAVEELTVPLPLHLRQELLRAGNDCFNLIRIQANQINKLSMRCGKHRQNLHSYVQLAGRRDKKISDLRTEVQALRSFIGERGWEARSIGGGKIDVRRIKIQSSNTAVVEKKPNRQLLIVKRDYNRPKSSVSAQPSSEKLTSSVGVKPTSDNRQKSSVGVKHTVNTQKKSSVSIPDTSGVLQKSSLGVRRTLNVQQKSSVAGQSTSNIPKKSLVGSQRISNINTQKSSVGLQRISDMNIQKSADVKRIAGIQNNPTFADQPMSVTPHTSSVGFLRTSDIGQNALVIQIDGMHNTVLQPKLVRLDDNSMETG